MRKFACLLGLFVLSLFVIGCTQGGPQLQPGVTPQNDLAGQATGTTSCKPIDMSSNVLLFHFEENGNPRDSSGNGHDGTWAGGGSSNGTGKLGAHSGSFDGVSAVLNVNDAGLPSGSSPRTAMMWIRPTRVDGAYHLIFFYGTYASSSMYTLGIEGNTNKYYISQHGSAVRGSTAVAGNWIQIASTYDGTTHRLYENGVLTGSGSMATTTRLSKLLLGDDTSGHNYAGDIDEVAIWSRALSATEIADIYNRQKDGYGDGYSCPNVPAVCGNGVREGTEQCDDGNTVNNDGCSNSCTLPVCGNGVVEGTEQCDDGNTANGDACTNSCTLCKPIDMSSNVLLFHFEENGNPRDSSGNGHDGTWAGEGNSNGAGKLGAHSGSFDGVRSVLNVNDAGLPSGSSPRTAMMWIRPIIVNGAYQLIFFYGTYASSSMYTLGIEGNTNKYYISQHGSAVRGSTAVAGNWIQIASTYDGTTHRLYENGVLTGSGSMATTTRLSKLLLGDDTSGHNYAGDIDEVAIWSRALSPTEIANIYQSQKDGYDGYSCPAAPAVCGNGVKEGTEQCDDGNTVNNDGCSNSCTLPVCGNGVVEGTEQCDDGNTVNNDGCSETCVTETTTTNATMQIQVFLKGPISNSTPFYANQTNATAPRTLLSDCTGFVPLVCSTPEIVGLHQGSYVYYELEATAVGGGVIRELQVFRGDYGYWSSKNLYSCNFSPCRFMWQPGYNNKMKFDAVGIIK